MQLQYVRAKKNSILPPEILSLIFSCLAHCSKYFVLDRIWIWVTHVCKYWRYTALENPRLWSHMCSFHHRDMVEAFLIRSKEAYITVRFVQKKYLRVRRRLVRRDNILNLPMVLEHMRRICDLEMDISTNRDKNRLHNVEVAFNLEAPQLKRFCITSSEALFTLPSLFASTALLKSLSAIKMTVPWNPTILQGLTELSLTGFFENQDSEMLSLPDLLTILKYCPNLENLALRLAGPTYADTEENEIQVNLPHLRKFLLTHVSAYMCSKFVKCVEFSSLVEWDIYCNAFSLDKPVVVPLPPQETVCTELQI